MPEYPIKWITEHLAVGYAPRSRADLESIRTHGISAIVNLCAECYDLNELEKKADFEVFYLPIPDEGAPEIEYLEKTLTWIEGCIANQKKVLIHCRYGIGRTGTVAIAYLFKKGLSLRQALNNMKHTPSIPMSDQQWRLLRKYSEKLGMPKAPVLEAQSEKAVASDTFFEKWAIMQKWFETD
ncbi:MAG: dual specificity protein phosphatase [Desulfobacteraceae bacterium]